MKKPSVFHGSARNILGFLLIAVASLHPALAQDAAKSQIIQNKADEQEVRLHTAAVVTQVQSLIDELAANGISGDDIKVLTTTKAVLSNLSSKEMDKVIASLQKAGETPGTKTGEQSLVDAYAGQKGIILEFRQILKEYEQRQAAYDLPVRFKELSDRQTDTMRTTGEVASTAAGKNPNELSTMQQTTEQIVQADQEALANEVALAQQQLDKAVQGSTGDEGKALQQAQQDLKGGQLQKALNQANDDLKAGQLLKALTAQAVARDELRRATKDLNPPANAVDALMATAGDLAKLIEEQKKILVQTNAAVDIKPRVIGLDEKQGVLVDETNLLQQDLQSLSAPTAGLVKDAINPMQLSRASLAERWGGPDTFKKAATNQQDAITKLEAAQTQLQTQVAEAQKAADDAAKDPVAKLQDLQKQIQADLQQQQQVAAQTTQAANTSPPDPTALAQTQQQQGQLQQQTAAMQQTALPLSLAASQALAKATDAMNQAQQAMSDPATAANAPAAQQAAQAALAQANQAVDQQIAKAEQSAAAPDALATAANSLQQAQDSVSSAIAAAAPPAAKPPSMAEASAALAAAAQHAQAAGATPGLPDAAASAVADAKADIGQGEAAAAKGDAHGTAAAAAAAQGALAQAQAAVKVAMAEMPVPGDTHMAGGPPEPSALPGPDMPSIIGAKTISGGSTDKGTLHGTTGTGKFVTVASRDRAVIDQTQAEKRPQEYAPMIDQYMKNLADQSSSSP